MKEDELAAIFPNLAGTAFLLTSPRAVGYNCIAWAAGKDDAWWWPDSLARAFWPAGVERAATIDAFVRAFASLGYSVCDGTDLAAGMEKIAIYAIGESPTHAARQLDNGRWTSKLGKNVDIEHELHAIEGQTYGKVACVLHRPRSIR